MVFLYLPFFIAQCLLLAEGGFAPQHYVPGLLFNLLLFTGTAILPLAAIATVTSNFARMTLTLLGIFLGFIVVVSVAALAFSNQAADVDSHLGSHICFALAVAVFAMAIVLQYALRRVWLVRTVLIALPLVLIAVNFFASRYDQAQMNRVYAISQGAAPIQLAYSPDAKNLETARFPASSHAMIPIDFHLMQSGVGEGYAILTDAVRAEITAPDGSHWDSGWQDAGGDKFLAGESPFTPRISMPMAIYTKFQSAPLRVHLALAITEAQAGRPATILLQQERFAVPDFGVCWPQTGRDQDKGIRCVAALREPQLTHISTRWSDTLCSASVNTPDSGAIGEAWAGSFDREPAQINISSVTDIHVDLSNGEQSNEAKDARYLCAGTPITFTQFTRARRTQTVIDITDFHLPKISVTENTISITQ